ncbi:MAG TPA: hydrogenase 4 subunit B [Caldimonas sp.]|nr:hydrogenase 4 subunit B [Caldimonas sp.]
MAGFPDPTRWLALDWVLVAVAAWLVVGLGGLFALRKLGWVAKVLFPAGGAVALLLFATALVAMFSPAEHAVLPLGLPGLPFHFRLDPLAGFFLMVIGATAAGVSAFAAGYFRKGEGTPPGLLCLEYHVFLASMALVVVADDAYAFMVMWETMALSSFFLVIANHRLAEIRQAGYLYLLIAHIGAIGILLSFGVLQANTGDYTFANMRAQHLSPFWASVAFLLALFGFGAKAGIVPLHVWLPEAHPAAPSPVSALMSAVMLKTAVYGLLRVTFDLLPAQLWWWGVLLLGIGLASALFGVVFAAVQVDMKRLLAYSSIENIGLVFAGIGLAVLFSAYGMKPMSALALTAALYHVASHAFFKSLLFVGTGAVLHATGQRSLGKLGGLVRVMPWVTWLTLVGTLASAGLPPLGGFVSEWLLLQSFLFAPGLPSSFLNMLVPVVAALIALVAALSGYTMVKFFGVVFLGQPREEQLADAHRAGWWERAGMVWLALGCVALGLAPVAFIDVIGRVTRQLVAAGLAPASSGWLLVPVDIDRASYGPIVFALGLATSFALAFALVRRLYHGRIRRAAPWDCGYPWQTARMQDTAEGFGQPIRQIFEPFFRMRRELPSPFDREPRYRVIVGDHFWHWLYQPVADLVELLSRWIGRLQQGRIAVYLLYSFLTLIGVLLVVRR